ncbi:MAG: ATP-binding protein [Flavobacteriaceae bacterium]|nr:ATP-binding protein [Flavobacteriaceae bacterium]
MKIHRMYDRTLTEIVKSKIGRGKAIVLIGPRQVGKTTLIKAQLIQEEYLFLDADDSTVRALLSMPSTERLKSIIGQNKLVFIDEAQRIRGIDLTLKIIVDQFKDVQLIVSGSSSFDLSNELNEPLTGRKWEYELLPISWEEYEAKHGYVLSEQQLENRLLYGFYPDVLNHPGEEKEILKQLVNSYLYKDIMAYSKIRKPEVLEILVQSLALQIGSEVNYNELSQLVGVDKNTISSYIDILQKGYVIFKLGSYSGNLRNEIKKNKKIYFYDTGVRNMVLGNFNSLSLRQDTGALWENFLIAERRKQNTYKNTLSKTYFWRTKQQQEVDFVEENNGKLTGFEFKWNAKKSVRLPKTFVETYHSKEHIIDKTNFREFVVI